MKDSMVIKFKNGYTVRVEDCGNKSKSEILNEAYRAMQSTKSYKKLKTIKANDAKDPKELVKQLEDCIRLFKKGPESYYDAVDELKNAVKTAKNLFPFAKFEDSNPKITYKSNLLVHPRKIEAAFDKKTGKIVDPEALDYEIKNMEIDMDADLNHENWHKKYMPEALQLIVDDYQKNIDLLNKIVYANKFDIDQNTGEVIDPYKFIFRVDELKKKLEEIKKVFKLDGKVEEETEEVEDAKCKDIPVAEPTASYSLNPDPYFSVDNIDDARAYLTSRDPEKKAGAIKILKNEFPAIRKNLENDIANADEFVEKFTKDQMRIFMETYRNILDVYNEAKLMAEYITLSDLYKELYYNALHLGRRNGREISGSKSVVARKRL